MLPAFTAEKVDEKNHKREGSTKNPDAAVCLQIVINHTCVLLSQNVHGQILDQVARSSACSCAVKSRTCPGARVK